MQTLSVFRVELPARPPPLLGTFVLVRHWTGKDVFLENNVCSLLRVLRSLQRYEQVIVFSSPSLVPNPGQIPQFVFFEKQTAVIACSVYSSPQEASRFTPLHVTVSTWQAYRCAVCSVATVQNSHCSVTFVAMFLCFPQMNKILRRVFMSLEILPWPHLRSVQGTSFMSLNYVHFDLSQRPSST